MTFVLRISFNLLRSLRPICQLLIEMQSPKENSFKILNNPHDCRLNCFLPCSTSLPLISEWIGYRMQIMRVSFQKTSVLSRLRELYFRISVVGLEKIQQKMPQILLDVAIIWYNFWKGWAHTTNEKFASHFSRSTTPISVMLRLRCLKVEQADHLESCVWNAGLSVWNGCAKKTISVQFFGHNMLVKNMGGSLSS